MTYAEKLQDPRWQKKRLLILKRDGFRCTFCQDTEITLHVHHSKYHKEPWDANDSDLKTVCKHCHSLLEFIKKSEVKDLITIISIEKVWSLTDVIHFFIYCTANTGKRVVVCYYNNENDMGFLFDITSVSIESMSKKLKKIKING